MNKNGKTVDELEFLHDLVRRISEADPKDLSEREIEAREPHERILGKIPDELKKIAVAFTTWDKRERKLLLQAIARRRKKNPFVSSDTYIEGRYRRYKLQYKLFQILLGLSIREYFQFEENHSVGFRKGNFVVSLEDDGTTSELASAHLLNLPRSASDLSGQAAMNRSQRGPAIKWVTHRVKPLAEVTGADVPPGFDPEDVATDCADE